MKLLNMLMISVLFIFGIFLIPLIEVSVGEIGAETLQPVLIVFPILFIGSLFVAILYVGFKE